MSRRSLALRSNLFPLPSPLLTVRTSPPAPTISSASTQFRRLPYRTVRGPAALVATIPPDVANAPEEGSVGRRRPYARAASFTCVHVTDAPARAISAWGSTVSSEQP